MQGLPVYFKTQHYTTPTISMYYPYIFGLEKSSIEKLINYEITTLLYELISELRRPDLVTYITGSYAIKTNEKNVLSLTLTGLGDFRGAHPITIVKAITIDVETGRVYELKDLFKPDSNYLEVLSEMINEQIQEREIPLLGEFKGVRADNDYYIADKGLVVYFQQYEIAPYYVGLPYFLIPIYDLNELIPEDGLLNRMIMGL